MQINQQVINQPNLNLTLPRESPIHVWKKITQTLHVPEEP